MMDGYESAVQQLEALIAQGIAAENAMKLGKRAQVALEVLRDDVTPGTAPEVPSRHPSYGGIVPLGNGTGGDLHNCPHCGTENIKEADRYRHQTSCAAKQAARGLS